MTGVLDLPTVTQQRRMTEELTARIRSRNHPHTTVSILTHESALASLCSERGAEAFDYLCDLWLRPYNANQKRELVGLDHHLDVWFIHSRAWPELDPKIAVEQLELL